MRRRERVRARAAWARWVLHVLSVVLTVGVAVAGNQILTDGEWSWWWTGLAAALTATGALVTHRLTRPPGNGPAVASTAAVGPSGQVVENSTVGGNIDALRNVTGSVRLRDTRPPLPPSRPAEPAAPPRAVRPSAAERPAGGALVADSGQRVSGTQAGGSITQIDGVSGDVTIERS